GDLFVPNSHDNFQGIPGSFHLRPRSFLYKSHLVTHGREKSGKPHRCSFSIQLPTSRCHPNPNESSVHQQIATLAFVPRRVQSCVSSVLHRSSDHFEEGSCPILLLHLAKFGHV